MLMHYVCAVVNSSPICFSAQAYTIETQFSTHLFNYLSIPQFDATNPTHQALAALSQEAHAATAAGDITRVAAIEAEIDQLAARLWGLTEAELRDIQESLAELG